ADAPLFLLPVLLLPAQLLAVEQPAMAGAAGVPIPTAASLHGLPAVPGTALALHAVRIAPLLQRQPFLARPVLIYRMEFKEPPVHDRGLFSSRCLGAISALAQHLRRFGVEALEFCIVSLFHPRNRFVEPSTSRFFLAQLPVCHRQKEALAGVPRVV